MALRHTVHSFLDRDLHLRAQSAYMRGGYAAVPTAALVIALEPPTVENRDRPKMLLGNKTGSWLSLVDLWDRCCSVLRALSLRPAARQRDISTNVRKEGLT